MSSASAAFFKRSLDATTLASDLHSHDSKRQMDAVKQILAYMTMGKDMSTHFNDISNLLSTTSIQLKKLVYLYLMHNAKSHPEKAVLHAGTFVHDTHHKSPLIRGIALRTMISMLVPALVAFLQKPIVARLRDADLYVRRIAAMAALKLYTVAPEICSEAGIIIALEETLTSPIASVVAAGTCAIIEILNSDGPLSLVTTVASRSMTLLESLGSCGEWSQLYLLEGVGILFQQRLPVITMSEAERVIAKVVPLLHSANAAVTTAAAKIVIMFIVQFTSKDSPLSPSDRSILESNYAPRVVPPMISLLSSPLFEIRFVALRNIQLLINGPFRQYFIPHVRRFFVQFDDPVYIKLDKIDAMLKLASKETSEVILQELVVYAAESDPELVRRAVYNIGILAVEVSEIAPKCVESLARLIDTKVNFVVQEAAVVVQTVLRQYPSNYEGVLTQLCSALDVLDEPASKAAVAWAVGEYSDKIENVAGILSLFVQGYEEEALMVQLSVLTAAAKAFVKSADEATREVNRKCFEEVLAVATTVRAPDVRDRAFFYWRLTAGDSEVAKRVLSSATAGVSAFQPMDKGLLAELLTQFGTVSSVLHQPASVFTGGHIKVYYDESDDEEWDPSSLPTLREDPEADSSAAAGPSATQSKPQFQDPTVPTPPTHPVVFKEVLNAHKGGKGCSVSMAWDGGASGLSLVARISLDPSATTTSVGKLTALQLNVNAFSLGVSSEVLVTEVHQGEDPAEVRVSVAANNSRKDTLDIQVALKLEPIGVLFFNAPPLDMRNVLLPATGMNAERYAAEYDRTDTVWSLDGDATAILSGVGKVVPPSKLQQNSLRLHSVNLVHSKEVGGVLGVHLFAATLSGQKFYCGLSLEGGRLVTASIRSNDAFLGPHFANFLLNTVL